MKILKTSLALLALIALMLPCTHAEEHHHETIGAELCAMDHATCRACSEEPCTKPKPVVQSSAGEAVAVPIRHPMLLLVFTPHLLIPEKPPAPSNGLCCLQTVQLLI